MRCHGRRGLNDAKGWVLVLHYLELRIAKINATSVVLKLFPARGNYWHRGLDDANGRVLILRDFQLGIAVIVLTSCIAENGPTMRQRQLQMTKGARVI